MNSAGSERPTFDILPLVSVAGDPLEEVEPGDALGPGFLIAPNLLITCWHCVDVRLTPGHRLAAAFEEPSGTWKAHFLSDIERDRGGRDLATARLDMSPRFGLQLSPDELNPGVDVWSFGYPLPDKRERAPGKFQLVLPHRFLKGYVIRAFLYDDPRYGETPSYELDMPTPSGLSGAPIVRLGGKTVCGVVYGSHDVARIEESASVDPVSGQRQPEVQRIVSFGLGLHTSALAGLRTGATSDLPLREHLRSIVAA